MKLVAVLSIASTVFAGCQAYFAGTAKPQSIPEHAAVWAAKMAGKPTDLFRLTFSNIITVVEQAIPRGHQIDEFYYAADSNCARCVVEVPGIFGQVKIPLVGTRQQQSVPFERRILATGSIRITCN